MVEGALKTLSSGRVNLILHALDYPGRRKLKGDQRGAAVIRVFNAMSPHEQWSLLAAITTDLLSEYKGRRAVSILPELAEEYEVMKAAAKWSTGKWGERVHTRAGRRLERVVSKPESLHDWHQDQITKHFDKDYWRVELLGPDGWIVARYDSTNRDRFERYYDLDYPAEGVYCVAAEKIKDLTSQILAAQINLDNARQLRTETPRSMAKLIEEAEWRLHYNRSMMNDVLRPFGMSTDDLPFQLDPVSGVIDNVANLGRFLQMAHTVMKEQQSWTTTSIPVW